MQSLSHYVLPSHHNNHKPHLVSEVVLSVIGLIAIFLFVVSYTNTQFLTTTQQGAAIITSVLVDLTNKDRLSMDLMPLSRSNILDTAAALKADDMVMYSYFAHTSPSGVTPWAWFDEVGYTFRYAGENLAVNFTDSEKVENAWMNSPSHKENILNPDFTEIGLATREGIYKGKSAIFVVQFFGHPAALPPSIQQVAQASTTSPIPLFENDTTVVVKNDMVDGVSPVLGAVTDQSYASIRDVFMVKYPFLVEHVYTIIIGLLCFVLILMLVGEYRAHHTRSMVYTVLLIILLLTLSALNKGLFLLPG